MSICSPTNTQVAVIDHSKFFNSDGSIPWDAHRIGWLISGILACCTALITTANVFLHTLNYYRPLEQRQIIRILLWPAVYTTFLPYFLFQEYAYYSLALSVYEALTVAAFLMLLVSYMGESTDEQRVLMALKDRGNISLPLCCFKFRPSKPYFMHTLKWGVLQYCLLRPLLSVVGAITQARNTLCPDQYDVRFAAVYLDSANILSSVIASYSVSVFLDLTGEKLRGRQPHAKKWAIALIFYTSEQSTLFSILRTHNVIKGTENWTPTNIANGLQALCTAVEMVAVSILMLSCFSSKPYRAIRENRPHTDPSMALLHCQNYWDLAKDTYLSVKFLARYITGTPYTHVQTADPDFDSAFGMRGYRYHDDTHGYGEKLNQYSMSQYYDGANGQMHVMQMNGNGVTLNGKPVSPVNGNGRY